MPPAIVFDNVSKKFRKGDRHDSLRDLIPAAVRKLRARSRDTLERTEFWALRDVSFEVNAGEALGIIGPNGAGKSTTLKLLTKILKPTLGRSTVRGRVGALIEVAAGFHPELTGRENVFLQGAIIGMKRREIAERFDDIIEFSGAGEFIDTPVKRYSSGMSARLGFSIAAHLRPDVLIIDEILSVGDMAFQQKCLERMTQFKRDGVAIVFVSHNLQAISGLCERCIYLASRVVASGPTPDVVTTYVRASSEQAVHHKDALAVTSAKLLGESGPLGPQPDVAPGTVLCLRIIAKNDAPLDDVTFGLVIQRSTDQLVVYNGHVHRSEIASAGAFRGEFCLDLRFVANLVRGHYTVLIQVFDNPTRDRLVDRQVLTFTVSENRTRGGIAHLALSATVNELAASAEKVG